MADTVAAAHGSSRRISEQIPEALVCAWVDVDQWVDLGEPFSVGLENTCEFSVQVREPDCTEEDLNGDWEGCARLEVVPTGADREGTSFDSGGQGLLRLEWFDPATPAVVATATWELEYSEGSGGWDSGPNSVVGRLCGCSTGTPALPWAAAMAGLMLLLRRRGATGPRSRRCGTPPVG